MGWKLRRLNCEERNSVNGLYFGNVIEKASISSVADAVQALPLPDRSEKTEQTERKICLDKESGHGNCHAISENSGLYFRWGALSVRSRKRRDTPCDGPFGKVLRQAVEETINVC
jgi:hypothetical protein